MKWKDIQDRVVAHLTERIHRDPETQATILQDLVACGFNVPDSMRPLNHLSITTAFIKEVARVVDAWDIRMVGKLREICPEAFPRNLKVGDLIAYVDPGSHWVVERKA
jgi:hypothetical protein